MTISDTLTEPMGVTRALRYMDYIFIIPGTNIGDSTYITDEVHVLNTLTDTVSLSPDSLVAPMAWITPVIVNNTIYAFGGWAGSWYNIWQQYTIAPPTLYPTIDPTGSPTVDPTRDPTSGPTLDPTAEPTFDPTTDPTIEPTRNPIIHPTIAPTTFSEKATLGDFFSLQNPIFLAISICTICICLCAVMAILMRNFRRIEKKISKIPSNSFTRQLSVNIGNISNGLVAIISIGKYDKHPDAESSDINGNTFLNLPVDKDVDNLKSLFEMLKYTVIPHKNKLHWTENEIIDFLTQTGKSLFSDNECDELVYDGLIVCISSHGIEDHIVTSDYKAINKKAIHRLLSMTYPKIRDIPRIFLYDSCDGNADMNQMIEEHGKYFGMEELEISSPTSLNETWTETNNNPDYKLVEIHAANTGFQAKLNTHVGSYMLYEFTKRMKRAIINDEDVTLGRLFDKIQNDLHEHGKQQIVKVFNNDTSHIRLKICNEKKPIILMDDNDSIEEAKEMEIDDVSKGLKIDNNEMGIELHELSAI